MTEIDPIFIATAKEVVLRAGEIQMANFGSALTVNKKGTIDLVTNVDLEVESMFRELIANRFPTHTIIAEELQNERSDDRDESHRWIFDPIDGTVNFAHGLPFFCASLALEINGIVSVGAVYDPVRKELFTAELGAGARLNSVPLSVSLTDSLIDALLCTGFPYDIHQTLQKFIDLFGVFVSRAQAVRRFGSAALDLCYVAAGRLDGFWEEGLKQWDTAAGSLIVEEAGGRVSGIDGERFQTNAGHIVASNRLLHDEMLRTIRMVAETRRLG